MKSLQQCISERILVLDGAMGTMIQRYNLTESDYRGQLPLPEGQYKGNNDMLCLTRPQVISQIHDDYLEAGADIIETCTFNATSVSLEDYGMERYVKEINVAAARLARAAADCYTRANPTKPRFVAGSVGPTSKTLSISPDVNNPAFRTITYDRLKDAYYEQMEALISEGVDALLIETIFDTLNAKAAIHAAEEAMESARRRVPLMLSVTLSDKGGRTLSGQTLAAFLTSVQHAQLLSIGLNCSFGANDMKPFLSELSRMAPYYVSAYPNAGLPNELGQYDQTPELMAVQVKEFIDEQLVNIVGGCCGTTPAHIAQYQQLLDQPHGVRSPAHRPQSLHLSGLEMLEVTPQNNFVNIGERCNVAGSRKFLRLINEKRYDEAVEIARSQVEDGAQIIDINMDDGMLDAATEMTTFLNLLMTEPEISRVPIMIDSSKFDVIEAGLKCVQGKCIVNSISLKEGEELFLQRAATIRRLGAAVVVMAFDEQGQADSYNRRIEVCGRAYHLLTEKLQFNPNDIIFDPNILAIATGMEEHRNYGVDYINTVKWIKQHLPSARVVGGVSNLSFALRGNNYIREVIHSVFLYHAIRNGMDMGIVNPSEAVIYEEIPVDLLERVEDVVLNRRDDATERLLEFIHQTSFSASAPSAEKSLDQQNLTVEEWLRRDLVKGDTSNLDAHIHQALESGYAPLAVIDVLLMPAMTYVGELFGQGKMFLPQVVKTARTMKRAVALLQPLIEALQASNPLATQKKKILLATVKGDVHDIGKNIVGVILACNGFEVIDLGVMIPAEKIVDEALQHNVDAIGVSGLITPSLDEMCRVAQIMEHRKMKIPLLIGGAATSLLHSAVKIAPLYSSAVIHVKDASIAPTQLMRLLHPTEGEAFQAELSREYSCLRSEHAPAVTVDPATAQLQRCAIDWSAYDAPQPAHIGQTQLHFSIDNLLPLINWKMFYHAWKFDARYAEASTVCGCASCEEAFVMKMGAENRSKAREALQLYRDAQEQLQRMVNAKGGVEALVSILKAHGTPSSIVVEGAQRIELSTPRQLKKREPLHPQEHLSLCDFVAPFESGVVDHVALFATTVNNAIQSFIDLSRKDDYVLMLVQTLSDRLAEAAAQLLHRKVKSELWGFFSEGIRPAVGYPSLPNQQLIFDVDQLMPLSQIGITLTESGAMNPPSSVCGLIIAHPQARYFSV